MQKLIKKDVMRSSCLFEDLPIEDPCKIPMESGLNPIYNILSAYAEFDQ